MEKDAVRDGDAEILRYRNENGGLGCAMRRTRSYPPHMCPLVVEAKPNVSETVDRGLSGNGANDRTNLVVQRNVLVAGSTRNKVRALQIERPELVRHDRFVYILQRLEWRNGGQPRPHEWNKRYIR